jgi:hypothetical protein
MSDLFQQQSQDSDARKKRRAHILKAAHALVGAKTNDDFDAVHNQLCAIDVVMVTGAPWLQDGIARDYIKDEAGYKKIGGSSNSPAMPYFFRSQHNLVHYLKRKNFYIPSGGTPGPVPGMVCFFDWEDRGRFNFKPDRSGVILKTKNDRISQVVLARPVLAQGEPVGYRVVRLHVNEDDHMDNALIGYSDLP